MGLRRPPGRHPRHRDRHERPVPGRLRCRTQGLVPGAPRLPGVAGRQGHPGQPRPHPHGHRLARRQPVHVLWRRGLVRGGHLFRLLSQQRLPDAPPHLHRRPVLEEAARAARAARLRPGGAHGAAAAAADDDDGQLKDVQQERLRAAAAVCPEAAIRHRLGPVKQVENLSLL